jgi:LysR family cys regulon transcriptional activator
MTLRQLRYLAEIARQSLNISAAAAALHTSQPGVSRQIQLLEGELGVELLVRRSNRVLGFTETGRAILEVARRLLTDAGNIERIAEEARNEGGGRFTIATSHLHARYTLPGPIKAFREGHPDVQLQLRQADPDGIAAMVEAGEVDIGISTETSTAHPTLVMLPGGSVRRSLIVPRGHALARKRKVTLADLARYPIVGYNPRSRAGQIFTETFRTHRIEATFVVSANDSDVIKAYVEKGLGISVVPALSVDTRIDRGIESFDVTDLFPPSVMAVSLRRDAYPRRYVTDFIATVAPHWKRDAVLAALRAPTAG